MEEKHCSCLGLRLCDPWRSPVRLFGIYPSVDLECPPKRVKIDHEPVVLLEVVGPLGNQA